MFYLVNVLIGRAVNELDRSFSYRTEDSTIQKGMRVLVSFGASKETVGFVIDTPKRIEEDLESYQKKTNIKLSPIKAVLDEKPLLDDTMIELAKEIASYYKANLIKVLQSMLPPALKPKDSSLHKGKQRTISFVKANPEYSLPLSKREKELYDDVLKEKNGLRKSNITKKKTLSDLLNKGALKIEEVSASSLSEIICQTMVPYDLTIEQEQVYRSVIEKQGPLFLLTGVTGSGKTEVYIRLAEYYLKQGKGVIVLVPEIALSDQIAIQFTNHFQEAVAILHSSLSDGKKYEEYQRILNGEAKIVLGTRSAIFAPVNNLSLIIIDEEHSSSYKQDSSPFYDAIRVSEMRVKREGCKLLLGSATPRVQEKAQAQRGKYTELFMNKRISPNQEKEICFVNMNDSNNLDPRKSSLLSLPLIKAVEGTLQRKEQVMILINRRGFSPVFLCRECQHVALCPNCDIPLNYHKRDDTLRCHHCGYQTSSISYTCACGSHTFLKLGYGTERAYEEISQFFPSAKVLRLDSDVSSNHVRKEILESFARGEANILIGTEIIAKGLDFPKVTLACILDADSSLRIPSYLSDERTFDLISQFVGRAGRQKLKGKIILQTYVPENPIIQMAARQDYDSFYQFEIEQRKQYQYPPYTHLTRIQIKGVDLEEVINASETIKNYLMVKIKGKRFNLYGPMTPYISHINGRYYRQILLKYKSEEEADEILSSLKSLLPEIKKAEVIIDVDPQDNA